MIRISIGEIIIGFLFTCYKIDGWSEQNVHDLQRASVHMQRCYQNVCIVQHD